MNKNFLLNVALPAILILTFLGLISLGCLVGGVVALFDGSPLWFALLGILLGVFGSLSTVYHLNLVWRVYKRVDT